MVIVLFITQFDYSVVEMVLGYLMQHDNVQQESYDSCFSCDFLAWRIFVTLWLSVILFSR